MARQNNPLPALLEAVDTTHLLIADRYTEMAWHKDPVDLSTFTNGHTHRRQLHRRSSHSHRPQSHSIPTNTRNSAVTQLRHLDRSVRALCERVVERPLYLPLLLPLPFFCHSERSKEAASRSQRERLFFAAQHSGTLGL